MDDSLMAVTETVTIPEQVSNWGKYFQLTAIGHKLNQGYDHPAKFWELEVQGERSGLDYHSRFLLPIYTKNC